LRPLRKDNNRPCLWVCRRIDIQVRKDPDYRFP
jgi:hypothetical protein